MDDTASWRPRAEAIALELTRGTLAGAPLLDVQRAFRWFPPGSAAGEALFRLAEALPRIPDRASRAALLAERVPFFAGWKAAVAASLAGLGVDAVSRQFVYAGDIGRALRRARRTDAHFSFDMLGEGARTPADASRNFARYLDAVRAIAEDAPDRRGRLGVSVKLSSIHP